MKTLTQIFGDNLRIIRNIRGLSQDALARQVGVSRPTLNRWENGHGDTAMIKNLETVASILTCKVDQLLGFSPITALIPDQAQHSGSRRELIEILPSLNEDQVARLVRAAKGFLGTLPANESSKPIKKPKNSG